MEETTHNIKKLKNLYLKNEIFHKKIVTFQGSGTLAIEMMILNFLSGRVLVVSGIILTNLYVKKLQKNQTVYTKLVK